MNEQFAKALLRIAAEHPNQVERMLSGKLITLDKISAVTRQLNMAAWLWFKDAEIAAVHTLTGAAFGILSDLTHHKTRTRPVPFDERHVPEELRPYTRDLRNLMNESADFLKHARKDPNETHELNPLWTEHYLFNAIKAYTLLNDGNCDHELMSLFVIRFAVLHPDIFGNCFSPAFNERWNTEAVKNLNRVEFFDRFGGPLRDQPPGVGATDFHLP